MQLVIFFHNHQPLIFSDMKSVANAILIIWNLNNLRVVEIRDTRMAENVSFHFAATFSYEPKHKLHLFLFK